MNFIINALVSALGKEVIVAIAVELTKWKKRKDIRTLVEDLIADEIRDLMYEFGSDKKQVDIVLKERKKKIASEVKIRLLAALK